MDKLIRSIANEVKGFVALVAHPTPDSQTIGGMEIQIPRIKVVEHLFIVEAKRFSITLTASNPQRLEQSEEGIVVPARHRQNHLLRL
jgi:hypothetical protein